MAINESVTGNDSVAITGTASAGERTVGVKGVGDSVGVQGRGKTWHGVEGISDSTIGGFANSESKGAAVYGEHKGTQAGIWGNNLNDTNQAGAGVVGTSKATGVVGISKTWHGIYGETPGTWGAGVWGEHKSTGSGVAGVSKDGVGIWGKGGRLAGIFEGDVNITKNLILQGVNINGWFQRIVQLEQQTVNMGQLIQRLNSLEQKVNALQSQVNTAISNLTGRVTQTEVAISDLKARVTNLGG